MSRQDEYDSGPQHDGCGGEYRETRKRRPDGSIEHRIVHADGTRIVDGVKIPQGWPEPGTVAYERKMYGG